MMTLDRMNLERQLLRDLECEQSLKSRFLKALVLFSMTQASHLHA